MPAASPDSPARPDSMPRSGSRPRPGSDQISVVGVTLVLGPEELLGERAVAEVIASARVVDPEVEVERVEGGDLTGPALTGLLSPSLFTAARVVVVDNADLVRAEVADALLDSVAELPDDCRLVIRHPGGARGRGLVDKLRRSGAAVVSCERPRAGDLPAFVAAEARTAGGSIARDAALLLVDAVGSDLRALSAAAHQLVWDAIPDGDHPAGRTGEGAATAPNVTKSLVGLYYGGHAQVSGFTIADAVLEGRTAEAVDRLRWALRSGVAPVLLVSAFATGVRSLLRYSGLPRGTGEAAIASQLGVPPWKVRTIRGQAAGWPPDALAAAQVAVAEADAAVKGAGGDAGFAVERLIVRLAGLRRAPAGARGHR